MQNVSFIVSLRTAVLSHTKSALFKISSDSFSVQGHIKKDTLIRLDKDKEYDMIFTKKVKFLHGCDIRDLRRKARSAS
jgi:hypothetical protein